ncbi:MAG: 50S ribosomal protein L32 [Candidatus Kerfeldbacteria bacterium RIFOXYA2_FULL_38_24]|uniref:Large ribosomal subunit protein bL32 n=1 Tax=Candidatus Kerfeldbacteria bacterium RIFOXYB2_FULL_38_14 TaxID=1798547 RepID=A0A1G2BG41_9BACT|nr:MAG: 50S ribosomal protein L32 [Candidatus Kerfeldbacteria bacterium RIFOXYA2_FULL_38_24]OGY87509.1 MAG: 50S ribosomal protein L32 [Candidatus Kerfeldbacteria bacterium RIFOXYB2_FULL_38_14]
MSVPSKRISKSRTRSRRAHHALTKTATIACPKCQHAKRPHYACPACGYYKGRDVLKKSAKVTKKITKKKEKK